MSKWKTWKYDSLISYLPEVPACYAVYLNGQLAYIGQTGNLYKRFASYKIRFSWGASIITPWGNHETVEVKFRPSIKYGDWAMIELRLIKRLQPPQNCAGSTKKRRLSGLV